MLFRDCYLYFPQDEEVISSGKNPIRKFFEGQIQYNEQEIQQLATFQIPQNRVFSDAEKLRMLYATKFKHDKALIALLSYGDWKLTRKLEVTQEVTDFFNSGALYYHGRDNRFRPIIVMDATKLSNVDLTLYALTIFLEYLLNNCMLPGQIENWVVIINLGGLGISQLPTSQLQKVMGYLGNNYRSRMHKCYLVNCTYMFTLSWGMIKGFLEDVTVNKISFEKTQKPIGLFEHANELLQIECNSGKKKSYQGPPREVSSEYQMHKNPVKLVSNAEYYQMYKQGVLNKNKLCDEIIDFFERKPIQNDEEEFWSCEEETPYLRRIRQKYGVAGKKN